MTKQSHLLIAVLFSASLIPFRAAPFYDLIRIQLPAPSTHSNIIAVAINDRGTFLGKDAYGTFSFLWKDGKTTLISADYPTEARALNNHDVVVGSAYIQHGDASYPHAWMYRSGTNQLLGRIPTNHYAGSVAHAINDYGLIVGHIEGDAHLFHPSAIQFPDLGGGPCASMWGKLTLVNNNGFVIGDMDGVPYIWPSFGFPEVWESNTSISPRALNNSNVLAGASDSRPAVLIGTNLTLLNAPWRNGVVVGINDSNTMVGQTEPPQQYFHPFTKTPLLWKDSVSYNLAVLVDLPPGSILTPVDINNSGDIAATLQIGEATEAVLLKWRTGKPLPVFSFAEVTSKPLVETNIFTALSGHQSDPPASKVTFTLYSRHPQPSRGDAPCWWYPPFTNSVPLRTNTATAAPFSTTFTNLSPGQYAYEEAIETADGVIVYGPRRYFAVAAPPVVHVRRNRRGEIQLALQNNGGYLYKLEVSADLKTWEPAINSDAWIDELPPGSANFSVVRQFFRAVSILENRDVFPNTPQFPLDPEPPAELTLSRLHVHYDGGGGDILEFSTSTNGVLESGETFTYTWAPTSHTLILQTASWSEVVTLRPGAWWEFSGKFSSAFTPSNGSPLELTGYFQLTTYPVP